MSTSSGLSVINGFQLRADTHVVERQGYIYICSSLGVMRIQKPAGFEVASSTAGESADVNSVLRALPDPAVQELIRRGLLRLEPGTLTGETQTQPFFGEITLPRTVQIPTRGRLASLIGHLLRKAGVTASYRRSPSDPAAPDGLVLPLDLPEAELASWARFAVQNTLPVTVYLATPQRLMMACLRPPETPCPVCLSQRIRAKFGWQEIADLPLKNLFGTLEDTRITSIAAAGSIIVETTLRALREADSMLGPLREISFADLTTTQHPILHLPHCRACGEHHDAIRAGLQDAQDTSSFGPTEGLGLMRRAVDALTGIVSSVQVSHGRDTLGSLTYAVTAGPISTSHFSPVTAPTLGGASKIDPKHAEICAVAEALERYACGVYDPRRMVRATLLEIGEKAIDPRSFPLGSPAEYETVKGKIYPFEPDVEMEWVAGRSLLTGEIRYVPACMVYVPYRFPRRSHILMRPISTGLAAGRTRDHATLAGLLEVVERDSLAIMWLNRLAVPTLDLSTLPPGPARDLWRRLAEGGLEIVCKLTTTDLNIPSVVLSAREWTPDGKVLVAHSARANLDLTACVKGALEELEQCRDAIRAWIGNRGVPAREAVLREIEDFFCYYSSTDRLSMLDFLQDGELVSVAEAALTHEKENNGGEGSLITQEMQRCGYEALAVDITPIDVAECGLSVVRAMVPGLQPISFNQKFRHLGGRRIYEAPVKMGRRSTALGENELNPDPIPAG